MNLVVFGHYLPSRLARPFSSVDPDIHFTILFEALTTLLLLVLVVVLHVRHLRAG